MTEGPDSPQIDQAVQPNSGERFGPDDYELARLIKARARELGFSLVGITDASQPETLQPFHQWLDAGMQGEMGYLANRREAYSQLNSVLSGVRSVIVVGDSYRQPHDDVGAQQNRGWGRIAAYARGRGDYHDVLKSKLKELAQLIHDAVPGVKTRAVVDTAPVLERDLARRAGLGWFGKNTMLIDKRVGSYFFLGALLSTHPLPADTPHATDHCGTCTRCLEICPTQAFPEPYLLDARRCIAYLTIELRQGPIPIDLRSGLGDWLFGCDLCQDVCPWNRKASETTEPDYLPRPDLSELDAEEILSMSDEEFSAAFQGTPLWRTGRAALARNAAIVLGNSSDARFLPALRAGLSQPDAMVQEACRWAIAQIERSQTQADGQMAGAETRQESDRKDHGVDPPIS